MSKTSFAAAAIVTLATLTGGISAANAGGMHMSGTHMNSMRTNSMQLSKSMPSSMRDYAFRHHHPRLGVLIANTDIGCEFLYDRWLATGSFFWKHKYDACRYGW